MINASFTSALNTSLNRHNRGIISICWQQRETAGSVLLQERPGHVKTTNLQRDIFYFRKNSHDVLESAYLDVWRSISTQQRLFVWKLRYVIQSAVQICSFLMHHRSSSEWNYPSQVGLLKLFYQKSSSAFIQFGDKWASNALPVLCLLFYILTKHSRLLLLFVLFLVFIPVMKCCP